MREAPSGMDFDFRHRKRDSRDHSEVVMLHVVGAHSVGKTSLCHEVAMRNNWNCIEELASSIIEDMELNLDRIHKSLTQTNVFQHMVRSHFEYAKGSYLDPEKMGPKKNTSVLILDRSICHYAYQIAHGSPFDAGTVRNMDIDVLRLRRDIEEGYSVVLFCRPNPVMVAENGIRNNVDMQSIQRIDTVLETFLRLNGIEYVSLYSTEMNDRVAMAENLVRMLLRNVIHNMGTKSRIRQLENAISQFSKEVVDA